MVEMNSTISSETTENLTRRSFSIKKLVHIAQECTILNFKKTAYMQICKSYTKLDITREFLKFIFKLLLNISIIFIVSLKTQKHKKQLQ